MQAVMGTLLKRFLAKQLGLDPAQIYHCAVMPCYDKKLEGSRDDLMVPGTPASVLQMRSCCSFARYPGFARMMPVALRQPTSLQQCVSKQSSVLAMLIIH